MDHEQQMMIVDAISHAAQMTQHSFQSMLVDHQAPSVLYRPRLFLDGDKYCVLLGDDLQSGVAGFGQTAIAAMGDFDRNFYKQEAPTPALTQ